VNQARNQKEENLVARFLISFLLGLLFNPEDRGNILL
jgi:hypothetical protein